MKRTEKIEVRVSQAEKQTLSDLASQDGTSVSGLIRGLINRYIALNSANTKRQLPKWQLAGLLVLALLAGHALTLIPMRLHENVKSQPVYYVHGLIGNNAFGVDLREGDQTKTFTIQSDETTSINVNLILQDLTKKGGEIAINLCEKKSLNTECDSIFEKIISVQRTSPSVLGSTTGSGEAVHLFVQELA